MQVMRAFDKDESSDNTLTCIFSVLKSLSRTSGIQPRKLLANPICNVTSQEKVERDLSLCWTIHTHVPEVES